VSKCTSFARFLDQRHGDSAKSVVVLAKEGFRVRVWSGVLRSLLLLGGHGFLRVQVDGKVQIAETFGTRPRPAAASLG
jgi:hypothetical protein